jgi:hypothetical protein
MTTLTTDAEISAAVAAWLVEHAVLPSEPQNWPIVRFRYADGTGGTVLWVGTQFEYVLRTLDSRPNAYAVYPFAVTTFRELGEELITSVHEMATSSARSFLATH